MSRLPATSLVYIANKRCSVLIWGCIVSLSRVRRVQTLSKRTCDHPFREVSTSSKLQPDSKKTFYRRLFLSGNAVGVVLLVPTGHLHVCIRLMTANGVISPRTRTRLQKKQGLIRHRLKFHEH